LEYIAKNGRITTKEYVKLNSASLRTARRDLTELTKKKIIQFTGAAKTGYYALCDGTVNGTVNKDNIY